MQPTTNTCKNCGSRFIGKFCNACGEKVYDEHDKRISHLFEEAVHFTTHFEGSFFTTIKAVLTRPGKYSADYCAGIRKKYFKPISLFLILVVIYLLFPFFDGLNTKLGTLVSPEFQYSSIAAPIAKKKMETRHLTEEELAKKYDKNSPIFAKLFILVLIPLSSLLLALLFITSRRYFFDHFILSIEIISFIIVAIYLILALLTYIVAQIWPTATLSEGGIIANIIYIVIGVYISIAFRNFYRQKWWISITKGMVFWLIYLFGIQYVYRILLYFLVMLFI